MKTKKTPNSTLTEELSLNLSKYKRGDCFSNFESINNILEQLAKKATVENHINVLKKLQDFLNHEDSKHDNYMRMEHNLVVDILVHFYLTLPLKHILRKTVLRILLNINGPTEIVTKVGENLKLIIKNSIETDRNNAVNSIGTCFDNFPVAIKAVSDYAQIVLEFLTEQLEYAMETLLDNEKTIVLLQNVLRVLVCVLQQCEISTEIDLMPCFSRLLNYACKVIESDVNVDLKNNASIVFIIAINHVKEDKMDWFTILLGCLNGEIYLLSRDSELFIYSGILNVISSEELFSKKINNQAAIVFMCTRLLELSESGNSKPLEVLQINRILTTMFRSVPKNASEKDIENILQYGLKYIWIHLDHYIDNIRHSTKNLFSYCLKIVTTRESPEKDVLLKMIISNIEHISDNRSSKYIALNILSQSVGCNVIIKDFPDLVHDLMVHLADAPISIYVYSAFETLMKQNMYEVENNIWLERWIYPLLKDLQNPKHQDLFAYAFKIHLNLMKTISWKNLIDETDLLGILLKVIKKSKGLIKWRELLTEKSVVNTIFHQNNEIRILTLSLIVETSKSTEVFNEWELNFLTNYFYYNSNIQDPSLRQESVSLFKRMLNRFRESYVVLKKQNKAVDYYITFINKFRKLLFDNLFTGASYARRVTALELLVEGNNTFNQCCTIDDSDEEIKILQNSLNDSYEGNKKYALVLLKACSWDKLNTMTFDQYIKCASSIRPAECISAAYKMQLLLENTTGIFYGLEILLEHLQTQLYVAKENLLKAAATGPMYGLLFCIRHLIAQVNLIQDCESDNWTFFIDRLIKICFELSSVVAPIINNSSPEGHLPVDKVDGDETITAQMVLICSWRTAKEVFLLLGYVALNCTLEEDIEGGFVKETHLLEMGDHFIGVLIETKHRGAFEQAYIGFNNLCERLWRCKSGTLNTLPKRWLSEILNVITDTSSSKSKLCATRRSAGVPFMVQVLITSELGTGCTTNFTICMNALLDIVKFNKHEEPRTHAMNILRALFRHNQLGELVSSYVSDGMTVAIEGFASKAWSERNSATLLFSALMVRIFGVQRTKDYELPSAINCMSARVFFLRYPTLHSFLIEQLQSEHKNVLYPVLLLLARLYPCSIEEDTLLQPFLPFIFECLSSKTFKIRQLAGRAIVPMLQNYTVNHLAILIVELMDVTTEPNRLHGLLVLLVHLLKTLNFARCGSSNLNVVNIIRSTVWILSSCEIVSTIYIHFVLLLSSMFLEKCKGNDFWIQFLALLPSVERKITHGSNYYKAIQFAKLYILANFTTEVSIKNISIVILQNLEDDAVECKLLALNIINYLKNFDNILFTMNELEYSEFELNFIKSLHFNDKNNLLDSIEDHLPQIVKKLEKYKFYKNSDYLIALNLFFSSHSYLLYHYFDSDENSKIINKLLETFVNDNDILNYSILSKIHAFLSLLPSNEILKLNFDNYINTLQQFSQPQIGISCRLKVAEILNMSDYFSIIHYEKILFIKLQLHEDEDQIVRDKISGVVISQKSRELLLNECLTKLSAPHNIALLLNIALKSRYFHKGQLFETDEWNDYSEELLLTNNALAVINKYFLNNKENIRNILNVILEHNLLTLDDACFKSFINFTNYLNENNSDVNIPKLINIDKIMNYCATENNSVIQSEKLRKIFEVLLNLYL